jgi:hypothetical protein
MAAPSAPPLTANSASKLASADVIDLARADGDSDDGEVGRWFPVL